MVSFEKDPYESLGHVQMSVLRELKTGEKTYVQLIASIGTNHNGASRACLGLLDRGLVLRYRKPGSNRWYYILRPKDYVDECTSSAVRDPRLVNAGVRMKDIVLLLKEHGALRMSELSSIGTCSREAYRRSMRFLIRSGVVEKLSTSDGRRPEYRLADPSIQLGVPEDPCRVRSSR